jgi:hypothetical protein
MFLRQEKDRKEKVPLINTKNQKAQLRGFKR